MAGPVAVLPRADVSGGVQRKPAQRARRPARGDQLECALRERAGRAWRDPHPQDTRPIDGDVVGERLDRARLVITGEGSLDAQTLHGKVPVGVARAAAAHDPAVPVIAVAGRCALTKDQLREAGIAAALPPSRYGPFTSAAMIKAAAPMIGGMIWPSTPAATCFATTSATALRTLDSIAAGSTACRDSRASTRSRRSSGRGRLPVWVVRKRSVLRCIFSSPGDSGRDCKTAHSRLPRVGDSH